MNRMTTSSERYPQRDYYYGLPGYEQKASRAWFLLPFFFGIIGGIIGTIALWNRDRSTAKMLLLMGFVFGFMWFILFMLIGLASMPAETYGPYQGV